MQILSLRKNLKKYQNITKFHIYIYIHTYIIVYIFGIWHCLEIYIHERICTITEMWSKDDVCLRILLIWNYYYN